MKPKEIFVKLGALVSFLLFIVGGGAIAVSGLRADNLGRFGVGVGAAMIGIFLTAIFATYIAHSDGQREFAEWKISDALKAAGTFTFFAACIIFFAVSLYFWIEDGFWQLGVAGVLSLVIMVFIAIEWSVRWQTGAVKKVLKDPDATEFTGRISSIKENFQIQILGSTKALFYTYYVDIGGTISQTFLRSKDFRAKKLKKGDSVKIKMNPEKTKYCAIIETADE